MEDEQQVEWLSLGFLPMRATAKTQLPTETVRNASNEMMRGEKRQRVTDICDIFAPRRWADEMLPFRF